MLDSNQFTWQPSAKIEDLKKRSNLMHQIRAFFIERKYWEVETPIMAQYGVSDLYLSNIIATFRNKPYFLQTSPEYHMKRLLAAGSGPIFQISRVFRNDEFGRWHNPEFTLLEWYQLNVNHHQMIEEVDVLLRTFLKCPPLVKQSYQEVFQLYCGINPHNTSIKALKKVLIQYELDNVLPEDEKDIDQYLFLLMSHVIEPQLAKRNEPTAVYGFPISQASLAKVEDHTASRFEVYFKGIELANGFYELTDYELQLDRFNEDNQKRNEKGLENIPIDPYFLQALKHGLPACTGVALGIDRFIALALEAKSLKEVISFDFSRA